MRHSGGNRGKFNYGILGLMSTLCRLTSYILYLLIALFYGKDR